MNSNAIKFISVVFSLFLVLQPLNQNPLENLSSKNYNSHSTNSRILFSNSHSLCEAVVIKPFKIFTTSTKSSEEDFSFLTNAVHKSFEQKFKYLVKSNHNYLKASQNKYIKTVLFLQTII